MKDFIKAMHEEYERLYDAKDNVKGYRVAVWAFDEFCKSEEHKELLKRVVEARGDFISSDREAAAFMFAMERFNMI